MNCTKFTEPEICDGSTCIIRKKTTKNWVHTVRKSYIKKCANEFAIKKLLQKMFGEVGSKCCVDETIQSVGIE